MLHLPRFLERLFRREAPYASESETTLFKKLHLHLTFWYSAVLGGALLIFCLVIYFSVQYLLFSSVRDELATQAQIVAGPRRDAGNFCDRQQPPNFPRPGGPTIRPMPPRILVACFDQSGQKLPAEQANEQSFQTLLPEQFLDSSLVKSALQRGNQTDIVDTGDSYGHIYRYARVIANPESKTIEGVILVGESIAPQESALNILLIVLLGTGGLVLLGAVAGGLFLSHRAMQPARLAFTRQQNFIANASHELRTPLTFLCANAEILLEERDYLPPEDVTLLEDIQTEATHMAALANNMLTLARLDMGDVKQHHEHDILDLTTLAESAVRQGKALADQRGIHLQAEGPKRLYVIGDQILLEQTILVLLENAIKYNRPDGQVLLRTAQGNDTISLEVQDTGIGIAPEHLPRLGERFYRVDKARSRAAGGTGLGLSIARGIIIAHGGSLLFASQPGQGTAVKITLPAMNAPIHDKKDPSQALT
jgi:signal transduction histidine kinase